MGTINSGHGLEGEPPDATFVPRNIEIRIRTGIAHFFPILIS